MITYSKYIFQLDEQSFAVETAGFTVNHSRVPETIVYNSDAEISFDILNTKDGSVNTQDITFEVSIHYGNGVDSPVLDQPNSDFNAYFNDVLVSDGTDISSPYTIPGGAANAETVRMRFVWEDQHDIGPSEFVYIKVKTTAPYVKEYVFRVVILGKMYIALSATDTIDAFSNSVRRLDIQTTRSFGAGLPYHKMKVLLTWDTSLSIDNTNPLVAAAKNNPENADSIVNGGSGSNNRYLYIYVEPSASQSILFYRNGASPSDADNITAVVEVMEADISYYNTWQAKNRANANFGWDRTPDGALL